jgi:UDP-glucose 4-epimerase
MHFAAYGYVGESTVRPLEYYDNNIGGTARLLSACAAFDCRNFVFSSSCATYGIPDFLPLTEDHAQRPVNPYGYSKLVVEQMLKHAEAVALRYFNAAGADPEGELGEMHDPETHLVPLILFAAMGRYPSVQILGTDTPRPMEAAFVICPAVDSSFPPNYRRVTPLNWLSAERFAVRGQQALRHLLQAGGSLGLFPQDENG